MKTKSVKLQKITRKYESLLKKHKIEFESKETVNVRKKFLRKSIRNIEKKIKKLNKKVKDLMLQEVSEQFERLNVKN